MLADLQRWETEADDVSDALRSSKMRVAPQIAASSSEDTEKVAGGSKDAGADDPHVVDDVPPLFIK